MIYSAPVPSSTTGRRDGKGDLLLYSSFLLVPFTFLERECVYCVVDGGFVYNMYAKLSFIIIIFIIIKIAWINVCMVAER